MCDAVIPPISWRRLTYTTLIAAAAFLALSTVGFAADRTGGQVIRTESSELRFAHPYEPGKIPVVLVHGLLGSPDNWSVMIDTLSSDPLIRSRYQFVIFRYNSLQTIPESGFQLAESLDQARGNLDPEGRDPSFERSVVAGHSLGGLVGKATSRDLLRKHLDSRRPHPGAELQFQRAKVARFIFVATPHRGAPIESGLIRLSGSWLAEKLRSRPDSGDSHASSIDQLGWEQPLLLDLEQPRLNEGTPFHSIIAVVGDPPTFGTTDGLAPLKSARLAGAQSEVVLRTHHLCVHQPDAIREVRRILIEPTLSSTGPTSSLAGGLRSAPSVPIGGGMLCVGQSLRITPAP
jgi:pimeloyl-ACP methyl ester carboxylesterase